MTGRARTSISSRPPPRGAERRGPSTRPPPGSRAPSHARLPAIASEEEIRGRLERLASLGARSAELAHELRNALAVLETSLHIVKKTLKDSADLPKVEKHLSRMAEQVHTGQALVREALDEVQASSPTRVNIDLRALVLEVVAGVARPDHVAMQVEVSPHTVAIDARLVRQLLLNLVRNAVEVLSSRTEAGCVRVIGKRVVDDLLLVVEDDGPGIDPQVAPRLFQAFNTSKANGTGLGLAVCRRIAEAHGGTIRARKAEPTGTAMEVLIPVG